jgi:glycosyltransferase involved in cell wall biosynthesis
MTKIAIVHDYFIQMGGAERVAEELHSIFPTASMVTTVDLRREKPRAVKNAPVKTSWMRHLPINQKNHRYYFLLYPFAVNSLDLSDFDLIISSSSGYAKGVKKKKGAVHICYCHTPMRWVWRYEDYVAREQMGKASRKILPFLLSGLKKWDLRAALQPDYYIANSKVVAERIREFYKRDAVVIPPPIDVERFYADEPDGDFYLLLSRLSSYKRLDLAIEACKKLDRPLVVIGDGPVRRQLEERAGPKTKFLGRQPDEAVAKYASRCREINAAGRPVIAFNAGGARETVIPGETGVFFNEQTPESLVEAIEEFEGLSWNRQTLRRHAEKFNRNVFASRILDFVGSAAPVVSANEFLELKSNSTFTVRKGTA